EVPDALGPCGVEEDSRAADVHVLGAYRVLHDLVDVGDGGEVKHSVAAAYRGADGRLIAEVADRCVDRVAVAVVRGGEEVEVARLVTAGLQPVEDVRADEPGAAGDEHPHPTASSAAAGV